MNYIESGYNSQKYVQKGSANIMKSKYLFLKSILFLAFIYLQALPAFADTINFQGKLTDPSGQPITGNHTVRFSLYGSATSGTAVWTEAQTAAVSDGVFSVQLGAQTALPETIFNQPRYLGIKVGVDSEMTPRQAMSSVPYAFNASTLQGQTVSAIVNAAKDEVRTPISAPNTTITVSGSYYLTQNIVATGIEGGIVVAASGVTIDLNGFTIDGAGTTGAESYGIKANTNVSNVTIKNGNIKNFYRAGVYAWDIGNSGFLIQGLTVKSNGRESSLGPDFSGIAITGKSRVIDSHSADNGGDGFVVTNSVIARSTAAGNGYYGIFAGTGSVVTNNVVTDNQLGVVVNGRGVISGNTISGNAVGGIFLTQVSGSLGGSMILNNVIVKNENYNIHVGSERNVLRENHIGEVAETYVNGELNGAICVKFSYANNALIDNTLSGCTTNYGGTAVPAAALLVNNLTW